MSCGANEKSSYKKIIKKIACNYLIIDELTNLA
jgi:hypothetical protein